MIGIDGGQREKERERGAVKEKEIDINIQVQRGELERDWLKSLLKIGLKRASFSLFCVSPL